jgi:hypothetical protein
MNTYVYFCTHLTCSSLNISQDEEDWNRKETFFVYNIPSLKVLPIFKTVEQEQLYAVLFHNLKTVPTNFDPVLSFRLSANFLKDLKFHKYCLTG